MLKNLFSKVTRHRDAQRKFGGHSLSLGIVILLTLHEPRYGVRNEKKDSVTFWFAK